MIFGALYLILYTAACMELRPGDGGVCLDRFCDFKILSGLSGDIPEARKHGMLADFMKDAKKEDGSGLDGHPVPCGGSSGTFSGRQNWGNHSISIDPDLFYYRHMAVKEFRWGQPGDLAGFFLQICELGILLTRP